MRSFAPWLPSPAAFSSWAIFAPTLLQSTPSCPFSFFWVAQSLISLSSLPQLMSCSLPSLCLSCARRSDPLKCSSLLPAFASKGRSCSSLTLCFPQPLPGYFLFPSRPYCRALSSPWSLLSEHGDQRTVESESQGTELASP